MFCWWFWDVSHSLGGEWLVNSVLFCDGAKATLSVFTASMFPDIVNAPTSEEFWTEDLFSEALNWVSLSHCGAFSFVWESAIEHQTIIHVYITANYSYLVVLQCYFLIPVQYHSSCAWHKTIHQWCMCTCTYSTHVDKQMYM